MTESKNRGVHPPEFMDKLGPGTRWDEDHQPNRPRARRPSNSGRPMEARDPSPGQILFEGKRGPQPVSADSAPDRLYCEIGCLRMELDSLKKSLGSACHDPPCLDKRPCRCHAKAPVRARWYVADNGRLVFKAGAELAN